METAPMVDGELTDNTEEYEASGSSSEGENFQLNISTTASIKARWLSYFNDNRITPPDVRRGEMVAIYQFSDTDEYWWCTLKQDKTLRRLETVVYSYSNQREENTAVDAKNSYWMEVSTHRKLLHLHTSKNDKEPYEYDIQINTKQGCITIKDDDGNYIFLDSADRHIKLRNKDDSFISINKREIHINAPDKILMTTNHLEIKARTDMKVYTTHYNLDASSTIKNQTNDYSIKTGGYKVSASSYKVSVSSADFSGNVTAGRNMLAGGVQAAPRHSGKH